MSVFGTALWMAAGLVTCLCVALGIAYGNAFLAAMAVAAVIVLLIALATPTESLMQLYVIVLILVPNAIQVALGGFALTATRALAPAILGVFLIRLLNGRESVRRSPLDLAIAFFALTLLVGFVLTTQSGDVSSKRYAISRLIAFAFEYFSVYYLVFWTVQGEAARRRMVAVAVAALGVAAGYGVLEAFTHHNFVNDLNTGLAKEDVVRRIFVRADLTRARSLYEHPISFGTALAMALPLALHLTSYARSERGRLISYAALAVMTVGLVASVSRGPYIAAILALACVFLFGRTGRVRVKLVVTLTVAGIVAVTFAWPLFQRLLATFQIDASVNSRLVDYPLVMQIFRAHPIVGQGLGTLNPLSFQYVDNYFLKTLGELGAVGVAAMLILLVSILVRLFLAGRRAPTGEERSLGVALFAAAVAFTFQTATFDSFSFSKSGGLYWALVAIGMSLAVEVGAISARPRTPDRLSGSGSSQR